MIAGAAQALRCLPAARAAASSTGSLLLAQQASLCLPEIDSDAESELRGFLPYVSRTTVQLPRQPHYQFISVLPVRCDLSFEVGRYNLHFVRLPALALVARRSRAIIVLRFPECLRDGFHQHALVLCRYVARGDELQCFANRGDPLVDGVHVTLF